jgi:hypothetical protein
VLRALWHEVAGGDRPYDPDVYEAFYLRLLARRHAAVVRLDTIAPGGESAYDLRVPIRDLVPTAAEARRAIREIEASHPDPAAVTRAIDGWRDG